MQLSGMLQKKPLSQSDLRAPPWGINDITLSFYLIKIYAIAGIDE